MERVKTIAWWVVAALFILWTLAAFPSLGCLFFLIGAAVSAPVPAVRDFWDEKGLRGAPKVALAVALLIAGSVAAPDSVKERGAEKEPPSEAAEIVEAVPSADAESVPDEGETAPPPEMEPEPVEETPEPVGYDALQELYVTFPLGASFQEAIAFLDAAGLPYSSEKYNGGRVCQVSTEKDGTEQKYNRSGLPYVTISYKYPSGENSANDVLEKYQFTRIEYYPAQGYFSFRTESETYGEIRRLGTNIGQNLTREEQIAFFYKYKDDKTAFR